MLWPGELPLNLVQGPADPEVEFLRGLDREILTSPISEVAEVQLLQLFNSQSQAELTRENHGCILLQKRVEFGGEIFAFYGGHFIF